VALAAIPPSSTDRGIDLISPRVRTLLSGRATTAAFRRQMTKPISEAGIAQTHRRFFPALGAALSSEWLD